MIDPRKETSDKRSKWGSNPVPVSDRPRGTIADDAQPKSYNTESPHAAATTLIHGIREIVGETQINEVTRDDAQLAYIDREQRWFDDKRAAEKNDIAAVAGQISDNLILDESTEEPVQNAVERRNFRVLNDIFEKISKTHEEMLKTLTDDKYKDVSSFVGMVHGLRIPIAAYGYGCIISYYNDQIIATFSVKLGIAQKDLTQQFSTFFAEPRRILEIRDFLLKQIRELQTIILVKTKAKANK